MIPTTRLAWLGAIATAVALIAAYSPGARGGLIAVDTVIVLAAAADAMFSRGATRVHAERQVQDIFSVGRPNAVTLELRNASGRALSGTVTDDPIALSDRTGLPARFAL